MDPLDQFFDPYFEPELEEPDCWSLIGWLLGIAGALAIVIGCVAFTAAYWLHRWGIV